MSSIASVIDKIV